MIVPQSIAANGEVLFLAQGSSTFVVASNEQTFTDVSGHWSDEHIGFVTARELFLGVSNDEFAPDREITREEMASMIVGFMQHAQITASTQNRYAAFDDEASISDWAAAAIQQLQESGILDGKPGNVFDPKGAVTRGEAAKVLHLLVEAYVN